MWENVLEGNVRGASFGYQRCFVVVMTCSSCFFVFSLCRCLYLHTEFSLNQLIAVSMQIEQWRNNSQFDFSQYCKNRMRNICKMLHSKHYTTLWYEIIAKVTLLMIFKSHIPKLLLPSEAAILLWLFKYDLELWDVDRDSFKVHQLPFKFSICHWRGFLGALPLSLFSSNSFLLYTHFLSSPSIFHSPASSS